jgi:16S rRNA (uracil1498-N3)-methyltransferase
LHRFFVAPPGDDRLVAIRGADARHAQRVLRLVEGDRLVAVIEGQGQYIARITGKGPSSVVALLESPIETAPEPRAEVWLFQCMPKADKMDLIVQRATELGASGIVPVTSSRTVPRHDSVKPGGRLARWRKIALEAAELSGRLRVPEVPEQVSFLRALEMARDFGIRLMPWEQERAMSLRQALGSPRPEPSCGPQRPRVFLMIGPEGGLSEQEAAQALEAGVAPVTLGPRMMRTENAGAVALAIILYELGDMG